MWMPTFDAAGMPTFVNPMQMANMAWNQGQAQEAEEVVSSRGGQKTIDRDLRRLASFFGIDEVTLERLDELMEKHSPEQRRRDLAKLYEILETARSPSRLLMAKTEEMEDGQFVTNFKRDEHIDRIAQDQVAQVALVWNPTSTCKAITIIGLESCVWRRLSGCVNSIV
ncbi:Hypothetical protein SCF082_LOCUS47940 [Durusdinium trenchii]|uniref:Uncharacterized protein n=1 Tax=Durusdinium trenchii TaxID=1381693 RepID=A0ABP0RQE1_9DINO